MRLTILQSNFARALGQVSRIVGARTTLPVLSNILISAKKGKIRFSATDLEVGISTQTIGKIDEEGEITLPARLLSDFVSNNKDESVDISTDGAVATLKSERFEAKIHGISAEEFPTVPEAPKDHFAVFGREIFSQALKKVNIAPATDETRPVLAGIYFQFSEKMLVLAATDSYRLAEKKLELTEAVEDRKFIVPARTMNEVLRLASGGGDAKELVKISAAENQISFQIGDTHIVSRLIEGSFPNYTQIIPDSFKTTTEMKSAELLSAVKMSSLFAKDSANNNIKVVVNGGNVTIASAASQSGSAKSVVQAKTTGENMEIAFNARYLLDILNVLSNEEVTLSFNGGTSAGAVRTKSDSGYVYIIMPLKLD